MQTTQEPPPAYTLPVVQPHPVTPSLPTIYEGYKSHSVRRLALAQIILGCFAFGFQLWDIINLSHMAVIAAGLWSGVFFMSTGCLGLASANQKTSCSIGSYMVMSMLSSFLAIGLLVVSAMNLAYYNSCNYYHSRHCSHITDYMSTCTIFLSTMLIIISLVEAFMAVLAASFACHGCCCSTPTQNVLSYTNPTQYVQGPNGELLLVTGQQPNTVTTMSGQQVLVTANAGSFQMLGLPIQGNYQTPGLVQPPAYQTVVEQAAGNQQPQPLAYQSATGGKTNTAYVDT